MPPLPPVQNVVRIRLKGTNQNTTWNNVLYLQYTPPAPTSADLTTLMGTIATAWLSNLGSLHNVSSALTGIDAADLTNSAAATASITTSQVGTRAGTAMPASVACVISWLINRRYRGGHPRTYLSAGVIADTQNGNLWTTTFKTAALAGARGFRTALNAATTGTTTYKLVTVSYRNGGIPLGTPVPYTINDAAIHGRVDTQRHRLGKETP